MILLLRISLTTMAASTLLYLVLSVRVISARKISNYFIQVPADTELHTRIRDHSNFAEYVPLALLFLALLELAGAPEALLAASGVLLIAARICHAVGLPRPAPNYLRLFGVLRTSPSLSSKLLWRFRA